jgi:naringenin degradation protein FdeH
MSLDSAFSVRRVVTGHDAAGTSIIIQDGPSPQPHRRANFVEIWNTSGAPTVITAEPATEPNERPVQIHPPAQGSIVRVVAFQPGQRSPMHRTATIDYGIVLGGEMYLALEDSETALHAGDIVVQRGTNHAWHNRSDAVATMAFVLIAAEFDAALAASIPHMELMP